MLCTLALLLGQSTEKVPPPAFQSHVIAIKTEAQREVGARPTDARWTGPPPQQNHSDETGSSWLIGNKELSSKMVLVFLVIADS